MWRQQGFLRCSMTLVKPLKGRWVLNLMGDNRADSKSQATAMARRHVAFCKTGPVSSDHLESYQMCCSGLMGPQLWVGKEIPITERI